MATRLINNWTPYARLQVWLIIQQRGETMSNTNAEAIYADDVQLMESKKYQSYGFF
jgi:hypothetical protein